jgi:hypothetical protein
LVVVSPPDHGARSLAEDNNGSSTPGGGGAAPRTLWQTAPAVLGAAMRLLAESYDDDPVEPNREGIALYVDFRPDVGGLR